MRNKARIMAKVNANLNRAEPAHFTKNGHPPNLTGHGHTHTPNLVRSSVEAVDTAQLIRESGEEHYTIIAPPKNSETGPVIKSEFGNEIF